MHGLEVRVEGPVGWLVFDRPERSNAMDGPMMNALPEAWTALDSDESVRCIVVTGNGKAFQTGLDMVALAKDRRSLKASAERTRRGELALTGWHLDVRTPVVTAVNGVCAGGGLHFVVDSDIAIASSRAVFLDPHVSVGQASAWEAVGLTHRVGASVAARMVLTGAHERLYASRALQVGLVSEVVAPDRLLDRARELAEHVAAADSKVVRRRKAALWAALDLGLRDSLCYAVNNERNFTHDNRQP